MKNGIFSILNQMQGNTVSNQVKHQKSVSVLRQSITQEQAILENELFSSEVCMLCVGAHTWVKCDLFKDQKRHARIASFGFWHLDIVTKAPVIVLTHCPFLQLRVLKLSEASTY